MSSFICPKCGKQILDSPRGYTTGCEHYPIVDDNKTFSYEMYKLDDLIADAGKKVEPMIPKKARNRANTIPLLKPSSEVDDPRKRKIYDSIPLYLLVYADQLDKLASYIPENDKTFRIIKYALSGCAKLLNILRKRYKIEK